MMNRPLYQNEKWLEEQFWEHERDIIQIATDARCNLLVILNQIKRLGIATWDQIQSRRETWLRKKYLVEELTIRELATQIGCSYSTIRIWMEEFGIPLRDEQAPIKTQLGREKATERICELLMVARHQGNHSDSDMVYLISAPNWPLRYKIGLAKKSQLENRLKTLQRMSPIPLFLEYTLECGKYGAEIEKILHRIFHVRHVHGEWFDLTDKQVEWIKAL